jgi:hypothetical protein
MTVSSSVPHARPFTASRQDLTGTSSPASTRDAVLAARETIQHAETTGSVLTVEAGSLKRVDLWVGGTTIAVHGFRPDPSSPSGGSLHDRRAGALVLYGLGFRAADRPTPAGGRSEQDWDSMEALISTVRSGALPGASVSALHAENERHRIDLASLTIDGSTYWGEVRRGEHVSLRAERYATLGRLMALTYLGASPTATVRAARPEMKHPPAQSSP